MCLLLCTLDVGNRSPRQISNVAVYSLESLFWKQILEFMDVKLILLGLTPIFILACLFFGTRNGFYDTDNYHGNGSAH